MHRSSYVNEVIWRSGEIVLESGSGCGVPVRKLLTSTPLRLVVRALSAACPQTRGQGHPLPGRGTALAFWM